ncbi:anaerobic ribonucleoside-triphosphate reductase activating protein [Uliginosibacterium gangwonense]|uniref:anaerobic ribonucleoside-triphosphate reductase activating protein n=1 Tax=Uliginosibacterium gangwonense TaxID=392736 RepID=UPI000373F711|nr:anaerobic ribonucleoside-triphosphate reductase activating protein [Uliginosibacterium gangwonense]
MEHPADRAPWQTRIRLGGFESFSRIDWPGRRAATIFLRGCPWRCAYCHNPQLQKRTLDTGIQWDHIAAHLEAGRNELDGVVFSGGEATAERCLPEAIAAIRTLGLGVGLHTNGAYPDRLQTLLPLLDWVGFDLKTDYDHYDALSGAPGSAARVTASAKLLLASGIDHEFRLTWHHEVITEESAQLAASFAQHLGVKRFVLQRYRSEGVGASPLAESSEPPTRLIEHMAALFADFEVRGEICALAPGAS